MKWYEMSDDAKLTAKGMIEHCVDCGIGMGMDEGFNLETGEAHDFLKELRKFIDDK